MQSADLMKDLLDYHYRRRNGLLVALKTVDPSDFVRDMGIGWKSMRNILVHTLECEEWWVRHVAIGEDRPPKISSERFTSAADLLPEADRIQRCTREFVRSLTPADLSQPHAVKLDGQMYNLTLAQILLHIITHDTHHRGQVAALMRQLGHSPPDLDFV